MKTKRLHYVSCSWSDFYAEFLVLRNKKHKTDEFSYLRKDWEKFYQKYFGLNINLSNISVPFCSKENYYLLFVSGGLTPQMVYEKWDFGKKIRKWTNYELHNGEKTDFNKIIGLNKRNPIDSSYAIWVYGYEIPIRLCFGQPYPTSIDFGVNLLEQMIFQSKYFSKTGKLLDKKIVTLCTGSRDVWGKIPSIGFNGDDMIILSQDDPSPNIYLEKGTREVISE